MNTLFLHGGPGFTSAVERRWFGTSLPVDWWDQPKVRATDGSPLQALADAAASRLRELSAASMSTVVVVANSFGGLIARQLCDGMPHLIGRVILLGCSIDPPRAVLRLARHVAATGNAGIALRRLVALVDDDVMTAERLFELVRALWSTPDPLSKYFARASEAAAKRYAQLAEGGPELDFETFELAMREQLAGAPNLSRSRFSGEVQVLSGIEDPLVGSDDRDAWNAIFPNAVHREVSAGHMIHFEVAPDVWLAREGGPLGLSRR
jgi:pimeloyl-ACP methyl ester carboxylesterase